MNVKTFIGIFTGCLFLSAGNVRATPLRLTAQPKGTNQVELTFGPVITNLYYEVLVRTNGPEGHWIRFTGCIGGSNKLVSITHDLGGIEGLTLGTLTNWTFVAGRWDDPFEDEMPPLYKELVLRADPFAPGDTYGNPTGDGWSNLQKMQSDRDPLVSFPPPAPRSEVKFFEGATNARLGNAVLTWELIRGPQPDYFLIERATRTFRTITNPNLSIGPGPNGSNANYPPNWPTNRLQNGPPNRPFVPGTNRPANWPTSLPWYGPMNRPANLPPNRPGYGPGNSLSNRPANRPLNLPPNYRPPGRPGAPREDPFVTGPFIEIARIPSQPGVNQYRYVDTNVDTLLQPEYRLEAHNTPPFRAWLKGVDSAHIRETLITASAQQTTNGYAVTVPDPIPYALYLLLVRDKGDSQWRASGYFQSGTNSDPINLQVDRKGMMSDGQRPIAMPTVKFLPDVIDPEFAAGWGEDSDGDGLPDIYEVLVTHTEPDKADTGNTGVLDGFKEMTGDGWSNLEKFRRRSDPQKAAHPPRTVLLAQPTAHDVMKGFIPQTDLRYEPVTEVRVIGTSDFIPVQQGLWMLYRITDPKDPDFARGNFDVRISWVIREPKPRIEGNGP